jgi:hypothetical protein
MVYLGYLIFHPIGYDVGNTMIQEKFVVEKRKETCKTLVRKFKKASVLI